MFESLFKQERQDANLFNRLNTEELSSDSYTQFKLMPKDNKLHLFMFYAPWCGHCKRKRTFLNNLVNNHSNAVKVHTFNCEKLKETDKFARSINGFPTFKMGYKQKTYDTDLLEFIILAIAMSLNYAIPKVIEELKNSALHETLKDELEQRKKTINAKFNKLKSS